MAVSEIAAPRSPGPAASPRPAPIVSLWAALGLMLCGMGQLYFHLGLPRLDGALWYALGLLALARAFRALPPLRELNLATSLRRAAHPQRRIVSIMLALAAGAGVASALAAVVNGNLPVPAQFITLAVAVLWIGVGWALDGLPRPRLRAALGSLARWEVVALVGILALAAAVRLTNLDSLPAGLWIDEAHIGLEGNAIRTTPSFRPMYAEGTTSPAAFIYLVSLTEAFLGATVAAVRLMPALCGVFSTLLAFVAGRTLWGPWAGLVAGLLYAVARWDINFSRIGMQGATTPVLTMLTVVLLLQALQSGRRVYYAGLGAAVGVLLWFYLANLFLLPVLALCVLLVALRAPRLLRSHLPGLGLAAVGVLLVAAPVLLDAALRPGLALNRPQNASLFRDKSLPEASQALVTTTQKHFQLFNVEGDLNGRHNLPGAPMLDPVTGVLLVVGLVAAFSSLGDLRSGLLLIWLLAMLLPGILSLDFEAPQSLRSIGVIPAAVLLATFGAVRLRSMLGLRWSGRRLLAVTGVAGLAAAAFNLGAYFWVQANDPAVWGGFSIAESTIGRYVAAAPADGPAVYTSLFYKDHSTIKYLAGTEVQSLEPATFLPIRDTKGAAIFLAPEEESYFRLASAYYPTEYCTPHRHPAPRALAVLYQCIVSQEGVMKARGMQVSYLSLATGAAVASSVSLDGAITRPAGLTLDKLGLSTEGSLLVESSGIYSFSLAGPPSLSLLVDERPVLTGGNTTELTLAEGLHQVQLQGEMAASDFPIRLLWGAPDTRGGLAPLPPEALFHHPVRPLGLTGAYRIGRNFTTPVAFWSVDPTPHLYFHVPRLPLPFTVEWAGSLFVAEPGTYYFSLDVATEASVAIDGAPIMDSHDGVFTVSIPLTKGWHQLRVNYLAAQSYTHIYLRWQPPGAIGFSLIPPELLRPW